MSLIAKSPASGLCRDAGSETGREVADLEPWGGASGGGRAGVPCAAREVAGVPEGKGRQNFRFSDFQRADIENCSCDDRLVPKADF